MATEETQRDFWRLMRTIGTREIQRDYWRLMRLMGDS